MPDTYAAPDLLADTACLAEHLGDPGMVVVEMGTKAEDFEAGHIPGAVRCPSAQIKGTGDADPRLVAPPAEAKALFESLGVGDGTLVVAYDRIRNRDALTAEMEQGLAGADVAEWVDRLNAAGVPSGPVLDIAQVFADPQVRAREMLVELPHPVVGTFRTTGLPVKLSESPGGIERRPPLHGEHTDEVLAECGLGADEIRALRRDEVI